VQKEAMLEYFTYHEASNVIMFIVHVTMCDRQSQFTVFSVGVSDNNSCGSYSACSWC